jgi:hypothetical protein
MVPLVDSLQLGSWEITLDTVLHVQYRYVANDSSEATRRSRT